MKEAEWLASTDVAAMLAASVHRRFSGVSRQPDPPSDRKLRLWACACCRQVWPLLTDERSRNAVLAAERYADGEATAKQAARYFEVAPVDTGTTHEYTMLDLPWIACHKELFREFPEAIETIRRELGGTAADLLRCVFGNPFSPLTLPPGPPVRCERCAGVGRVGAAPFPRPPHGSVDCPACGGSGEVPGPCPWLTADVVEMAAAAYAERPGRKCPDCPKSRGWWYETGERAIAGNLRRYDCASCHGTGQVDDGTLDPDVLGKLRDALLDAGCPEEERYQDEKGGALPDFVRPHPLLEHLRSPGPHFRGCFAIDALTGRT